MPYEVCGAEKTTSAAGDFACRGRSRLSATGFGPPKKTIEIFQIGSASSGLEARGTRLFQAHLLILVFVVAVKVVRIGR